jgi:pimeloyl-ACP methyl ester carboxylesterase
MAEVNQPTLVVYGQQDRQIPPEDSQILAEALPNARVECFTPAGHNRAYKRLGGRN